MMIGSLIGILVLVLDVIAIISVLGSGATTAAKLLWILLIVLLPVVGMVLYFLLGPGPRSLAT
ncbi:MAG: PLDc N-terminal domain-containing protein [Phycisphaerales bacterium]|nr:PLDc N-terminal domain-containing protein [Phycisphaerales bacterium]